MAEPDTRTSALLASLWQRNLPQLQARLDLLDQAAASDPLPDTLRAEAASVAHKLAGSLGMFGYPEGTRLARQLEVLLESDAPPQQQLVKLTQELRLAVHLAHD
jgi:HPt (histidine-containing phosphotransfer) domain-containing protein